MKEVRAAYAAFEKTILDLYEQKMLTVDLLDRVATQYRQVCMDSAGSQHVQTRDGKDLHQVCIELIAPSFPLVGRGSSEDHEAYWEQELKKWQEIVYNRWGWRRERASFPIQSRQNKAA
ncbi:MAG: hypothetical protein ACJ8BW_15625 [Ktedonobacteraceae bacterium]